MATAGKRVILILVIQVRGMESGGRRMLWKSDIFDRLSNREIWK